MKPLFRQVLAVLVGGALGAVCRVEIGGLVTAAAGAVLPVGILCVNMAGSFLLGLLTGVASNVGLNGVCCISLAGLGWKMAARPAKAA